MDISGTFIESFLLNAAAAKKIKETKPTKHVIKRDTTKRAKRSKEPLKKHYNTTVSYEAGIDEAGRGPMFGRVYSACVILPHNSDDFDYSCLKDSKRFTSKKKLLAVYEYIKEHAVDYCVCYEDEKTIDTINILQATQQRMHNTLKGLKNVQNIC